MPAHNVNLTEELDRLRGSIDKSDAYGTAEGDAFVRVCEALHLSVAR